MNTFAKLMAMALLVATTVSAQDATGTKAEKPTGPKPFTLENVPKHILKKDGPYLALAGNIRNGRTGRTGVFFRSGCTPLRFKMRLDEKKIDKMTIDLDGDGKFDGEPEFNAPTTAEGITQTVTKNGKKIQLHVAKVGMSGLALRNAQWYLGQVEVDGIMRKLAVIDLDFNGLKFDGTDAYVLDANGDGKFVPWVADREEPLKKTMIFGKTICSASFDAKTKRLSVGEMMDLATITLKHPFEGKPFGIEARTTIADHDVKLKVDGSTVALPPGDHDRVTIQLSLIKDGKVSRAIAYYVEKVTAKLDEKTTVTLPKPIAVSPRITQTNRQISVKEELVFEKAAKTVKMASRFYVDGLYAPAPKVALYKGQKLLASGAMRYG